jgi:hypothetical protein
VDSVSPHPNKLKKMPDSIKKIYGMKQRHKEKGTKEDRDRGSRDI